jgi:hypothetical protein
MSKSRFTKYLILLLFFNFHQAYAQCRKFKAKKEMIDVSSVGDTIEVSRNSLMYLQVEQQTSTGLESTVAIKDDHLIIIDEHFAYDKCVFLRKRRTGEDHSTRTYVLSASKTGSTSIEVNRALQGETSSQKTLHVIVVEP